MRSQVVTILGDNNADPHDPHWLAAPELPHIRLGVAGKGVGRGLTDKLSVRTTERLQKVLKIFQRNDGTPQISEDIAFLSIEIFCEGIGPDAVSDFCAWKLFDSILEFNDGICKKSPKKKQILEMA